MPRPLQGALIGFGFIAENGHVPAYVERGRRHGDVALVAVADTCPARREAARRCLPGVSIYRDAAALLSDAALELDFVDIATPPRDHASIAHAALERGLHVLCEKPLATTPRDARALIEHATRARRVLFPCHNYKHAPVVKAVNAAIARGAIGNHVRLLTMQTFRPTHARGVAEWRPDWRRERDVAGGGIAMDHGSHTFYLAFDWLGSLPTSVSAQMSAAPGADTEDNFSCSATFPTGVLSAHLTWTAGVRKVLYTIHGDRGAIRVEDDDIEISTADPALPGRWSTERASVASDWMDASHAGWFVSLFGDFVAAVRQEEFAGREARQALAAIELIAASYTSARRDSRKVRLEGDGAVAALARAAS